MTLGARPGLDLGEALDTAPCGFVSFADSGEIRAINRTLTDLLGVDAGVARGQLVETLFTVPTRIFYQTHFFPMLRLHGRAEEVFLTLRARDGTAVHVLANATRVNRDDEWRNDCVFMRIQERHRYEDALIRARKAAEEANLARMRFLSMMSHDLRTPINAISGYADLILMGIRGEVTTAQQHDLERIKSASAYLLDLLNDILIFAKIESGQVDVALDNVRLGDVLANTEALIEPAIRSTGLRWVNAGCPPDLVVHADQSRLQQVLLNLLTNAIKFTPTGGTITLTCEAAGDAVRIQVSDTGAGIARDRLEWIFEPFTQLDPHSRDAGKGVGLGLAISRQLARAMGGDVAVESEPGRGSTFTVTVGARKSLSRPPTP